MAGLGVENESPPDPLQPPLKDGIHLRWQFGAARGFPWYGYYLFRKPHDEGDPVCVRGRFRSLATNFLGAPFNGALGTLQHSVPEGTFTSDRPLIVTDDFPPASFAELDLRDRDFLRYQFAEPARWVRSEIGFRKTGRGFTCLRVTENDPGVADAPRVVEGARIWARDFDGRELPRSELRQAGQAMVLDLVAGARIALPCVSDEVLIALISGNTAGGAVARDAAGGIVDRSPVPDPVNGVVLIQLQGAGITEVELDLPQDETQLLALCWHCTEGGGANPEDVEIRYFAGTALIGTQIVSGNPGDVVTTAFSADLVTLVEYRRADAALVDVCYVPVRQAVFGKWKPVGDCPPPIALPVRDPQYPASGNLPADQPGSEATALGRIRYGDPNDWQGGRFDRLYDALRDLVDQGPAGPVMANVGDDNVPGVPAIPGPQQDTVLQRMRPLSLLMAGALEPQVAQMLGLYCIDTGAVPGERYDYMIAADHANVAGGNANAMLAHLQNAGANPFLADAWICFDLSLGTPAPLAQPAGLRAYALPGSTREAADGGLEILEQNAGLRWAIPKLSELKLAEGAPVLYRIRRADLGQSPPQGPAPTGQHQALGDRPHAVTDPKLPPGVTAPERAADWPPFAMHYIDGGLAEGWYSYRLTAIDIFGRWSPLSDPAEWWQWAPPAGATTWVAPWYQDTGQGDALVNANAISLLDKVGPPPPTAVEAFALAPGDRYLERDARFAAWFATLSAQERLDVTGLRVRWLWSFAQMRQAPDCREFRVYLSPGLANTRKGRIASVAALGATQSRVTTTIANAEAAGAWTGAILRAGARSFQVVGSGAGAPLVLDVANLGTAQDVAPAEGLRCALTLPGGSASTHPLAANLSRPADWDARIWVTGIDEHVAEGVVPGRTASGGTLAGSGATAVGATATLPAGTDLAGVRPLDTHLFLAADTARPSRLYRIMAVDVAARQATLDAAPTLAGGSDWEIGTLVRRYELFLPAPGDGDRAGISLPTTRADPVAYAQVAVSAADDKAHTGDDPGRAGTRWGDRTGNEGRASGPATVYRVHRTPPPAPRVPPDSDSVFASAPDYNRRSYYTVRWEPEADVLTHVFRSLDLTVFALDWRIRQTRTALSGSTHADLFPAGFSAGQRNAAAAALNAIAGPGSYAGLSADAREVLGRLPGNEGYASAGGLDARDWLIRRTRGGLGPGDTEFFPDDWTDALLRQAAADLLNAIAGPGDYDGLSNNALRVLAGLPGLDRAFTQITDLPLPNTGAATANRAGPDNPPGFAVDPALRAFIDRLDGRARNRFFYRTGFVDDAQNPGPLGLSSPPVYLRNVAPPRRPVFIRALAGDPAAGASQDRKITLVWASNREPDLAVYRLFRTAEADNARTTRLMDLIAEIAVPAGDPALRPGENLFLDADVPGLVTFTYRMEALDTAGNRSQPSDPIAARAFDAGLPQVPATTLAWVEQAGTTRAQLDWTTEHEVMVQRREPGGPWIDLAQWRAPGTVTVRDPFSDPTQTLSYRLLVRKYTGARVTGGAMELAPL